MKAIGTSTPMECKLFKAAIGFSTLFDDCNDERKDLKIKSLFNLGTVPIKKNVFGQKEMTR